MKKRLLSLMLIGTLSVGTVFTAHADEISDMEAEAAAAQGQLDSINDSINSLETEKGNILNQIDDADKQLVLTLATITTLDEQIVKTEEALKLTENDLAIAEEEESVEYEAMKKRIQYLYETGGNAGWATMLLEERDISDFLNQAEYTQKIYEYDRNCLEQYQATVEQVTNLKNQYETEKTNLENMRFNQVEQQAYLEAQLAQLRATSSDYDAQLANATSAASSYVAIINQQNAKIQELLEAQAAAEAAAASEAQAAAEAAAYQAAIAEAQAAAEAAAAQAAAAGAEVIYDDNGNVSVEDYVDVNNYYVEPEPQPTYYDDTVSAGYGGTVDRAYAWVGRAEYVWGACSPGAFDCSGFVSYCVTGAYARIGTTYTFMTFPQVSDPVPGDICTNDHHCGIYIGGGMMIHASDYGVGVIIGPVPADMIYVRY